MSDLFYEVKEDLRHDQVVKFWRNYGSWVIGGIIAILTATAGTIGWQTWCEYQQKQHALVFDKALRAERDTNPYKAIQLYEDLAKSSKGYRLLASFRLAAISMRQDIQANDVSFQKTIDRLYQIERSRIDEPYRSLAAFLRLCLSTGTHKADVLLKQVEPLTVANNPWQSLALELKAVLAQDDGNANLAAALLSELSLHQDVPHAFGMRVKALLTQVKRLLPSVSTDSKTTTQENS